MRAVVDVDLERDRARARCRAPRRGWRRRAGGSGCCASTAARRRFGRACASTLTRARASARARREDVDLLGGADRDADRGRRAEAGERADDHPFVEKPLEERVRVVAGLDVDEVADATGPARGRARAATASRRARPSALTARRRAISSALVDARERGDLRGRRQVERPAHLRHRGADVARPDGVADAQARRARRSSRTCAGRRRACPRFR